VLASVGPDGIILPPEILTPEMKIRFLAAAILAAGFALTGCETFPDPTLAPEEQAIRAFDFQGVRIGSRPGALAIFPQVQRVPIKRDGMDVYEIFNPSPQVSNAVAFYVNDRLRKLELRYFDGPGARTLSRAGGWAGIRDLLISRYGPPSRFGQDAPNVATQRGLDPKFAKFNGEWIFSRVNRQLNFIVMSDSAGGVGVVTVQDTTPLLVVSPAPTVATTVTSAPVEVPAPQRVPARPDPGF